MRDGIESLHSSYDAIVVGGRCSGAATAMLLARQGLTVLLVEQGGRGADTLSTLALMRCGVLQLARWDLLDAIAAAGTPAITTTSFYYGENAIEIRIKPRDGVDALYAPRRTILDPLLADAAQIAGADVAYRVRLTDLRRDSSGRVTGAVLESGGTTRTIGAAIVIGADGSNSKVAARVGAEPYHVGAHASGVIYTRVRGLELSGYHRYYVPGSSVGVIPTNGGDTLVFAAASRERMLQQRGADAGETFAALLHETAPALAAAVDAAPRSAYRGFAGRPGFLRPAWGPGWALVGDAGYFKDPITAHGITDALRDAEILAHAIAADTDAALAEYQAARDELSRPLLAITDEIASYAWDLPRLQVLHKSLSDEMAREVAYVAARGWDGEPESADGRGLPASMPPAPRSAPRIAP